METNRRSVAEEAAARTREAMEHARSGKKEIEDRARQMALPEHHKGTFAEEHPLEAALGAVSLFYLVTRILPVRALLGALFRLGWVLLKPAAILYGGMKLIQLYRDSEPRSTQRPTL